MNHFSVEKEVLKAEERNERKMFGNVGKDFNEGINHQSRIHVRHF